MCVSEIEKLSKHPEDLKVLSFHILSVLFENS